MTLQTIASASAVDEADLARRLGELTLEQKVRLLTGADFWSLYPVPAAGLRRMVLSDGPAGVRGELWDERYTSVNIRGLQHVIATLRQSGHLPEGTAVDPGFYIDGRYLDAARARA